MPDTSAHLFYTMNKETAGAASNRFVAPAAGTYQFGASLLYKINSSSTSRMRL